MTRVAPGVLEINGFEAKVFTQYLFYSKIVLRMLF